MKNMKIKRKNMNEVLVVPRGMRPLTNGEAASPAGVALDAVNVRECEQSLQVTGRPAPVGRLGSGERLLTMAGSRMVTCRDGQVLLDGQHGVPVTGDVMGAHVIGPMIVVVTTAGVTYLLPDVNGWQLMDPADAVPTLSLGASVSTDSAPIAAVTFATPYSQWRAPLADVDCTTLHGLLLSAWNTLNADGRAQGYRTSPVLMRWAVRLTDGSYLWMSDPVRVGDETLANAERVAVVVDSSGSGFTGTQATTMTLKRYLPTIAVTHPIAAAWQPLVAGIDVLATDEAQLVNRSSNLDYRCLTRTTGGRETVLEMGLSRRSTVAIDRQLKASRWHVVATAPSTAQAGSDFEPPVHSVSLSADECSSLARPLVLDGVVCSTASAGRLYCCTAAGEVVVTAPGNALVEHDRRTVLGMVPRALAVVTRPLYSGGFGRYPVYVFGDDGIYAIPQSVQGRLGEARLVDRTVIGDVAPVEGGGSVWMVSRHGHLCRLRGAVLEVCLRQAGYRALAWCNAHEELWLLPPAGEPQVLMGSGTLSRRTVDAVQLYSDPMHALAVSSAGDVMDLERELPAAMPVLWHTHPVSLHPVTGGRVCHMVGDLVKRMVWHLVADDASLTLRVTGQMGVMAGDVPLSEITLHGPARQPLACAVVSRRVRTVRLVVSGTAATGTLLLPAILQATKL